VGKGQRRCTVAGGQGPGAAEKVRGVARVAGHPPTQRQFVHRVGVVLQALLGARMADGVAVVAGDVPVPGRGCEKIGTGTFATAGSPGFSPFRLGASPIFSQPGRVGLAVELRRRAGPEREPRRIRRLGLLPDTLLERLQSRFAEENLARCPVFGRGRTRAFAVFFLVRPRAINVLLRGSRAGSAKPRNGGTWNESPAARFVRRPAAPRQPWLLHNPAARG
jgi:hypothetical protein